MKSMQNLQKLGWFLFIASFLPWLAILFVVPFLPLSIAEKTQANRCCFSCASRSLFLAERGNFGERSSYQISELFESPLSLEQNQKF
jgi:hypothetical protein